MISVNQRCLAKCSSSIGRNDNFLAKARKLSILPTSFYIFDIRQHYVRILCVSQVKVCYVNYNTEDAKIVTYLDFFFENSQAHNINNDNRLGSCVAQWLIVGLVDWILRLRA